MAEEVDFDDEPLEDPLHGQLYMAAEKNDINRFHELINMGANIDESYEDDMGISTKAILHVCCAKGRCDMVEMLLNSGAFIHVRDKWGQTPLMFSLVTQFVEVAEILLTSDPSTADDQDSFGKSALHIAVEMGNIESVKLLLNHGACIDIQNLDGYTPLMLCCYIKDCDQEVLNSNYSILQCLVDSGADINIKERLSKRTAIQMAAVVLNLKAVEILLAAGADPNEHDGAGRTPITNAMFVRITPGREFNPDVIALIIMLIQCGADLNLNKCESMNPLVTAVTRGAEPIVNLLLSYGVDVNVTFSSGATAMLLAATKNKVTIIKTLIYYNSRLDMKGYIFKQREQKEYCIDSMEYVIMEGNFDLVRLFTAVGYNLSNLRYLFGKYNVPDKLVENPEMLAFLKHYSHNPWSLFDAAVFTIRRSLGLVPDQKIDQLPLPSRLKYAILLKHVLKEF